eukprot:4032973-Amphidinium_carterae.1
MPTHLLHVATTDNVVLVVQNPEKQNEKLNADALQLRQAQTKSPSPRCIATSPSTDQISFTQMCAS